MGRKIDAPKAWGVLSEGRVCNYAGGQRPPRYLLVQGDAAIRVRIIRESDYRLLVKLAKQEVKRGK